MLARATARTLSLVLLPLWLAGVAEAGEPEPITSCAQSGAKRQQLITDIDCLGESGGVGLPNGGKLDLNGFTISNASTEGVWCAGRCKVFGGGTIEYSAGDGIEALGSLKLENVTIRRSGDRGINGWKKVKIRDSTIIENIDDGVAARYLLAPR